MVKGTGKKCSNRGDNGHNSRSCNRKGTYIKLFGVEIAVKDQSQQSSIQKSFSMGHLQFLAENNNINGAVDDGYLSEGQIHSKKHEAAREVQRGKPWTEEEHRVFLEGLSNVRKGDWRRISKNYVTSRTPVQVASHAQKYFLRLTGYDKKKRRRSLFDMRFRQSESESAEVTPNMTQPLSFLQTMNNASTSHGASAPVDQPPPRSVQDDMSRLSSKFRCFFINGERSFGAQDFSP